MKAVFAGCVLIGASVSGFAAVAQTAPPAATPAKARMADKLINVPGTGWVVYGPAQTNTLLDTGGPKQYPANRVTVAKKPANPWDAGASSAIAKLIAAQDVVLVAVYLRAPLLKDGETTGLSYIGLSQSSDPYTQIAGTAVRVTNQWKLYYASGRATRAYAADGAAVNAHLGSEAHVVELGPVLVYDLGPDADIAKLPKNG